jgi:anti-anti-sigma factor
VVVIRCNGSIVTGEEARALQAEVEKQTIGTKKVVLNLAEVTYVDSGGLGALIRICNVLRAGGGDLILCQVSAFVTKMLQVTNLVRVVKSFPSEQEAIGAFSSRSAAAGEAAPERRTRVLCVDSSTDLLAFISALLRRRGYEVATSKSLAEARTLMLATRPRVLISGPGVAADDPALNRIRQINPQTQFLQLAKDFSSAEASHSGPELVEQIQSLLKE